MFFIDTTVIYCDDGTSIHTNNTTSAQVETNEDYEMEGHKFSNLYYNIKNRTRRRLFWELCEVDRGNYNSYKQFKKHWNNNINITSEMKKDLKTDLDKLKVIKHTIVWIFNRRQS